jgi:hypothetical protein
MNSGVNRWTYRAYLAEVEQRASDAQRDRDRQAWQRHNRARKGTVCWTLL